MPELIASIQQLMKDETAGDPMTGLLWTRKTRQKISDELAKREIHVCPTTVGDILKELHYSLKCNSKKVSNGGRHLTKAEKETHNTQFDYIANQRSRFQQNNLPIISVDMKKKELIGNFKNPGTRYRRLADLVNDHDFIHYAKGKAFPYGVFDKERCEGFMYVGQSLWDNKHKRFSSSDTPEFAAETIARWWKEYGKINYPQANELLILADAGGSNGYRCRMWKYKLHECLAQKYNIKITVCHYPPGKSKWNPIEHRLFSEISKAWKGTPLTSFEIVVKYIRKTKTKTGLRVKARMVLKKYQSGKTVSKDIFKYIPINNHDVFPQWNYSVLPV